MLYLKELGVVCVDLKVLMMDVVCVVDEFVCCMLIVLNLKVSDDD